MLASLCAGCVFAVSTDGVCTCVVCVCLSSTSSTKYGHYEAELSLRGLLVEINERQSRAKKKQTAGPVSAVDRSSGTQGPADEEEEEDREG